MATWTVGYLLDGTECDYDTPANMRADTPTVAAFDTMKIYGYGFSGNHGISAIWPDVGILSNATLPLNIEGGLPNMQTTIWGISSFGLQHETDMSTWDGWTIKNITLWQPYYFYWQDSSGSGSANGVLFESCRFIETNSMRLNDVGGLTIRNCLFYGRRAVLDVQSPCTMEHCTLVSWYGTGNWDNNSTASTYTNNLFYTQDNYTNVSKPNNATGSGNITNRVSLYYDLPTDYMTYNVDVGTWGLWSDDVPELLEMFCVKKGGALDGAGVACPTTPTDAFGRARDPDNPTPGYCEATDGVFGLSWPSASNLLTTDSYIDWSGTATSGTLTPDFPEPENTLTTDTTNGVPGTYTAVSTNDVRNGTAVGNSETGNLVLPAENNVRATIGYGSNGTEFIGNVTLPSEDNTRATITYGANGSEYTGNNVNPDETKVLDGIGYGASGTEYEGNVTLPTEDETTSGVGFGSNGTEYTGNNVSPDVANVRDGTLFGPSSSLEGTLIALNPTDTPTGLTIEAGDDQYWVVTATGVSSTAILYLYNNADDTLLDTITNGGVTDDLTAGGYVYVTAKETDKSASTRFPDSSGILVPSLPSEPDFVFPVKI